MYRNTIIFFEGITILTHNIVIIINYPYKSAVALYTYFEVSSRDVEALLNSSSPQVLQLVEDTRTRDGW